MASGILTSLRPAVPARPSVASADRRSDGRGGARKGNWWTPVFGWSPEPDYIEKAATSGEGEGEEEGQGQNRPFARRKFSGLTEEKAKELRKRMVETETFHDVMYHSAIASRLASDLQPRRSSPNKI